MWLLDDEDENTDAPVSEPGEYNLGDDVGERIGEDSSSDNIAL